MSRRATIVLDRDRARPGRELTGVVRWKLAAAPAAGELRLRWDLTGKGNAERELVGFAALASLPRPPGPAATGAHPFRDPGATTDAGPLAADDARTFRFELPTQPYSFVGKLITLTWSIEVELDGEITAVPIVVAPGGRPVTL